MINKNILKKCHTKGHDETEVLDAYKLFFGTLVSESRIKIINTLRKQEMNVTELTKHLEAEQTAISHDLARLKKCGFVHVKVKGKYRYYALNKTTIKPLMDLIEDHMNAHCIHIIQSSKGGKQ